MSATAVSAERRPLDPSWLILPVSMLVAVGLGFLIAMSTGKGAGQVVSAFVDGAFGSPYAIGASVNRATVLAMIGIGFCWAYRARLVNVGGEGQLAVGGIACTWVALYGGASVLPAPLSFLAPVVAAAAAGAAWGAIAGAMKVRYGTNEVISTLLLGFIALWVLYAATHSEALLRQPMTSSTALPESLEVPEATRLPLLTGDPSSPMHVGVLAAVIGAALLWVVLNRFVIGRKLRAVGLNERAATNLGIRAAVHLMAAMAVAGSFAGAAGAFMVMGEQYNLKAGFTSGYGFDGLVVGLLSRGSPLAVLFYATFFGFLRSGGISMEISAGVPSAVVLLVQGVVVVVVAGAAYFLDRNAR